MRVAIASDHGGFEQKQELATFITQLGHTVIDKGPTTDERVDYPDYAQSVARAIIDGNADRGVLVCGTGIGMAIAANKLPGIRAANVTSPRFAVLAREHNDANIIALSGRFVEVQENKATLSAFLETPFAEGRHARRIAKIAQLEE